MPDQDWRTVRLFEADCFCCVVVVEGFSRDEAEPGWLDIRILSPSNEIWRRKVSTRLRRAWSALKAEHDEFITIFSVETADALIDAMIVAREKAWGETRGKL